MKRQAGQETHIVKKIRLSKGDDFDWLINFNLNYLLGEDDAVACPAVTNKENVGVSSRIETATQDGRSVLSDNCNKKPTMTYAQMITDALEEKGPLTLSEICQWISEHFPYHQKNDQRWKNSVRHTLTVSHLFQKGEKARHRGGHFWTVNKEHLSIQNPLVKRSAQKLPSGISSDIEQQYLNPATEESEMLTDLINPVPQDLAVRESGLISDTDYELDPPKDEDESNKNPEWTYLKTSLGLNDDEMGLSLALDSLFDTF